MRYIEVHTGLSDSVNTEVLGVIGGGELPEHTQLIVGEEQEGRRSGGEHNPFVASPCSAATRPKTRVSEACEHEGAP